MQEALSTSWGQAAASSCFCCLSEAWAPFALALQYAFSITCRRSLWIWPCAPRTQPRQASILSEPRIIWLTPDARDGNSARNLLFYDANLRNRIMTSHLIVLRARRSGHYRGVLRGGLVIGLIPEGPLQQGEGFFLAGREVPLPGSAWLPTSANLGLLELMGWAAADYQYGILTTHSTGLGQFPRCFFSAWS